MSRVEVEQPELRLGKYHIVRPLKVGGTAAIYLAVLRGENNFSREVVIKRPLPHLVSDSRARLMFIDEAHIASRLSHPNICQVLDLVSREDELYLVLEYLKGVDLRELLKRSMELGRFVPVEVAVWIAIETAAGLEFAHEAKAIDGTPLGLVHRDVSPKNIRITDSGSVKVIDFGIARAQNRATETAVGTIKGTLGYMSPEQIMGDDIDRRSDIFAFGIVLFQMLTLRNPFDGPTLKERVRRLTQAPIPAMREFNGALDDEIEAIVARCLDRDVTQRYQRMRDVQRDLDRYLGKLQTSTPRQRLIHFLEDIFPNLHDADAELKNVLTEISSIDGRIDTTQRLRFPDDEGATPAMLATVPTTPVGATAATVRDPSYAPTKTAPFGKDRTEPVPAGDRTAPYAASDATMKLPPKEDASERQTVHTESAPIPDKTTILGAMGGPRRAPILLVFLLAVVAGVAAAVAVFVTERWSDVPIVEDAGAKLAAAPDARPAAVAAVHTATSTKVAIAPDAGAPVVDAGAIADRTAHDPVAHPTGVRDPVVRDPVRRDPVPGGADRARSYFKTAVRLDREGRTDDARLMYTLAFDASGKKVDAAIYRNLGLLHDKAGDLAKARACFRGYLERAGDSPDADRIRTLLSSFPPTKSVACVDAGELERARKTAARSGAMIDAWVSETVAERLR